MTGTLPVEEAIFEPLALSDDIRRVCTQAQEHGHHAIAVPSSRVEEAYEYANGSDLKISCLVGFPFGNSDPDVKRFETEVAVDCGAHEINLMASLSYLKECAYGRALREMRDVVNAADERPVKVFIEPFLLVPRELEDAVKVVLDSGAQFVATTLWSTTHVLDEVRRLREFVGDDFGIIATANGERFEAAEFATAGANRLLIAKAGRLLRVGERAFGI